MSESSSPVPRALVVYESMYGNTHAVAEAIAEGMTPGIDVEVLPVDAVGAADLAAVDVLVVGAPTHAWSLSRPSTRKAAVEAAAKPQSGLHLDPNSHIDSGMREWLAGLPATSVRAAAFDTRMRAPLGLSGSAARGIARRLRRAGFTQCASPRGFRVTRRNQLVPEQLDRARLWGRHLAAAVTSAFPTTTTGQSK